MSTMNRACDVFAGPTTSTSVYAKIGSVNNGENITVKFKETVGGVLYYYIQYSTKTDPKCGYVPASAVTLTEANVPNFTSSASVRYIGATCRAYFGPTSTYEEAFPIPIGKSLTYLGRKEANGYALVSLLANGKTYRVYIDASNLRTASPGTYSGAEQMRQIANLELGNGGTKYQTWFYGTPDALPWCAIFVSWCANYAGILTTASTGSAPKIFKSAAVGTMRNWFYNNGRYVSASSYTPKRGDLAFFSGDGHVAIVQSVSGNQLTLVEGNYTNKVAIGSYSKTSSGYTGDSGAIVGFGKN